MCGATSGAPTRGHDGVDAQLALVDEMSAQAPTPSSISYVAGWSKADPTVLTAAATNVLRAVNTIAAVVGLDDAAQTADVASVA
jgi:hypothetical protein